MHEQQDLAFPLLADIELEAITAFGVLHRNGPRGRPIAIPAHFLIDRDGRIVWEFIATKVQLRPNPADVFKEVRKLTDS